MGSNNIDVKIGSQFMNLVIFLTTVVGIMIANKIGRWLKIQVWEIHWYLNKKHEIIEGPEHGLFHGLGQPLAE